MVRCDELVLGMVSINDFFLAEQTVRALAGICDVIVLRMDRNIVDGTVQRDCRKLSDYHMGCRILCFDSYTHWNRWTWREELLRYADEFRPGIVLTPDADETFDANTIHKDLRRLRESDAHMMLFDYNMVTSDGRDVEKYPPLPHCKAFKWEPGLSFVDYRGFGTPNRYDGTPGKAMHALGLVNHFCYFTKSMEAAKVHHR